MMVPWILRLREREVAQGLTLRFCRGASEKWIRSESPLEILEMTQDSP